MHILLFSQSVTGHYLEYLHHLYMGGSHNPEIKLTIVAPHKFEKQSQLLNWPPCPNISFDLQPDNELSYSGHWLWCRFRFARCLRRSIKKHRPDKVFVLAYMLLMPFAPLLLPSGSHVSGILYELYVYRWKSLSFIHKCYEVIIHWMLVHSKKISSIKLLNDVTAPKLYNRLYGTDKFSFIPDPVFAHKFTIEDFRAKYNIPHCEKIYLHFGSMGRKKGTLLILKTLAEGNRDEWFGRTFVFVGHIPEEIRQEFQSLVKMAKTKANVMVFPGFCSYDDLCNWCIIADTLLLPYLETYNSSGCIGYAARFGVPVIATGTGLLGKLVKHYKLGLTIPQPTIKYLRQAILNDRLQPPSLAYSKENTPEQFAEIALKQ